MWMNWNCQNVKLSPMFRGKGSWQARGKRHSASHLISSKRWHHVTIRWTIWQQYCVRIAQFTQNLAQPSSETCISVLESDTLGAILKFFQAWIGRRTRWSTSTALEGLLQFVSGCSISCKNPACIFWGFALCFEQEGRWHSPDRSQQQTVLSHCKDCMQGCNTKDGWTFPSCSARVWCSTSHWISGTCSPTMLLVQLLITIIIINYSDHDDVLVNIFALTLFQFNCCSCAYGELKNKNCFHYCSKIILWLMFKINTSWFLHDFVGSHHQWISSMRCLNVDRRKVVSCWLISTQ